MGSPINDLKANYVWPMFEATSGTRVRSLPPEFAVRMAQAPEVPTTSIFSKSDGVGGVAVVHRPVAGRGRERRGGEPATSACPSNPWALHVVADRLAQPIGEWQPFKLGGARRLFFPGRR